jgi:hypothetical protein
MSYSVCFISGILVYSLEADLLVLPQSWNKPGTSKEQVLNALIPKVIFFAKLGI